MHRSARKPWSANTASSSPTFPSAASACWSRTSTSSAGPPSASATRSPPAPCWAPIRSTRTSPASAATCASASGNKIREHYTISRGTQPESATEIGDGNYIMTSGHIAHNCKIGNDTVICSCALVAGHVEIEDQAFISGGVVIHQFLEDRAAGHDRRQHARQSGCTSVLPVLGFQYRAPGIEPGRAEARRLRPPAGRGIEEGVRPALPLRARAGGSPAAHRSGDAHRTHAAPGAFRPIEQARHLPPVFATGRSAPSTAAASSRIRNLPNSATTVGCCPTRHTTCRTSITPPVEVRARLRRGPRAGWWLWKPERGEFRHHRPGSRRARALTRPRASSAISSGHRSPGTGKTTSAARGARPPPASVWISSSSGYTLGDRSPMQDS